MRGIHRPECSRRNILVDKLGHALIVQKKVFDVIFLYSPSPLFRQHGFTFNSLQSSCINLESSPGYDSITSHQDLNAPTLTSSFGHCMFSSPSLKLGVT